MTLSCSTVYCTTTARDSWRTTTTMCPFPRATFIISSHQTGPSASRRASLHNHVEMASNGLYLDSPSSLRYPTWMMPAQSEAMIHTTHPASSRPAARRSAVLKSSFTVTVSASGHPPRQSRTHTDHIDPPAGPSGSRAGWARSAQPPLLAACHPVEVPWLQFEVITARLELAV